MSVLSVGRAGRLPWLVAVVVASLSLPQVAEASFKLTSGGNEVNSQSGEGTTWWGVDDFPPRALNAESVASKTKSSYKLSLLYKAENEDPIEEEGKFKDHYSTEFQFISSKPKYGNSFDLKWDGPHSIDTSSKTYLVVKTGNKKPNQFIFDISQGSGLKWDGKSTISGYGFWSKSCDAISHIAIYGKKQCPPVIPEPTSCVLLSLGIACMAGYRSRRRQA